MTLPLTIEVMPNLPVQQTDGMLQLVLDCHAQLSRPNI